MTTLAQRLNDIKALPSNWDSYGADPIDVATIDRAKLFMDRVNVVPLSDGGVQFEWHTHGIDLEIEFTPDGKTLVMARAANDAGKVV